jgi:hypothetical protein
MTQSLTTIQPDTLRLRRDAIFERARARCKFTLDGEPAIVLGRLLDFPVISTGDGKRAEINWTQLETFATRGGVVNVQS